MIQIRRFNRTCFESRSPIEQTKKNLLTRRVLAALADFSDLGMAKVGDPQERSHSFRVPLVIGSLPQFNILHKHALHPSLWFQPMFLIFFTMISRDFGVFRDQLVAQSTALARIATALWEKMPPLPYLGSRPTAGLGDPGSPS